MGVKISDLAETIATQSTDIIPIVQNGQTKKIQTQSFMNYLNPTFQTINTTLQNLESQLNERNICCLSLHSNFTITQGDNYLNVAGLDTDLLIGTKLTVNSGKIVIGSNVHNIRISASMAYQGSSTGSKHLRVIKNDVQTESNTLIWRFEPISNGFLNLFGNTIVPVQENDEIGLFYYGKADDIINGNNYGKRTSLIVEVID